MNFTLAFFVLTCEKSSHLREELPYHTHIGLGRFAKEDYDFDDPSAEFIIDQLTLL